MKPWDHGGVLVSERWRKCERVQVREGARAEIGNQKSVTV
jgi:hypothetical protein